MRKLVLLAFVGLLAQLVDGSLGMGYGVTSSTLLLAGGLGPAAASAAVHFSEIGTSLVSGRLPPRARQHRLAHRRDPRGAGLRRRLRRRHPPGQPRRRRRRARGRRAAAGPRRLRHLALPRLGRAACAFRPGPSARFLAPIGLVARRPRRGRRRRLGPGGHHLAAVVGPARAAQGRGLGRHRGVRGRGRRLARLPRRAGSPGHRLGGTSARCCVGGVVGRARSPRWLVRHLAGRGCSASRPAA